MHVCMCVYIYIYISVAMLYHVISYHIQTLVARKTRELANMAGFYFNVEIDNL